MKCDSKEISIFLKTLFQGETKFFDIFELIISGNSKSLKNLSYFSSFIILKALNHSISQLFGGSNRSSFNNNLSNRFSSFKISISLQYCHELKLAAGIDLLHYWNTISAQVLPYCEYLISSSYSLSQEKPL